MTTRIVVTVIVALIAVGFLVFPPIPQDPAYHAFADSREILGIPNFWNVMSNLGFLLIGAWGLAEARRVPTIAAATRWSYVVFFAGLVLTSVGSAWYHLAPDNASLGWDRLAMTIAFAGLFPALIAELVNPQLASRLLIVMLVAGPASVSYWLWTESHAVGDLRPYAVIAFLPMIIMLVLLLLRGRTSDMGAAFGWLLGLYVVAKVFEFRDMPTLDLLGISGHSLKHIFAALAAMPLVVALRRRQSGGSST